MRPFALFPSGRGLPATAVVLALAFALAASACGPSFQVVYEGDQKFEHCYALDDNPTAPMRDKGACWRDWMRAYTFGQTRDRVEYAAMRARALARAPSLPTDEALMEAAPGESTKRGVAAPAPTSAFAPPPKTMFDEPDVARHAPSASAPSASSASAVSITSPPSEVTSPAPPALPRAGCQDDCSHVWDGCRKGPRATKNADEPPKNDFCTKSYKSCMRACFK